jgi:hypothetical protein
VSPAVRRLAGVLAPERTTATVFTVAVASGVLRAPRRLARRGRDVRRPRRGAVPRRRWRAPRRCDVDGAIVLLGPVAPFRPAAAARAADGVSVARVGPPGFRTLGPDARPAGMN